MKTQTNLQPPNIALPQAPGHSIEVLVRHHPHVGVLVVQQSEEHLHGHGEVLGGLGRVPAALAAHHVRHGDAVRHLVLLRHRLV